MLRIGTVSEYFANDCDENIFIEKSVNSHLHIHSTKYKFDIVFISGLLKGKWIVGLSIMVPLCAHVIKNLFSFFNGFKISMNRKIKD